MYWVDFPDFLSNVEDIQVQRGAGSAFYGPPAIGGSINIITSSFSPERRISAFTGFGSYDTRRYSVSFNSGLLRDHWVISGRASQILSDGYRERSWLDFKSFFLGIAHFTRNTSTRVHFYGGPIEDHLAFYGISKEEALNRSTRRRNPITGPDEIENFNQPHLELINTWRINDRLTLNNTLFYIRGYGFFDYDGSWAPFSYFRLTPEYGFDVQGDPDTLFASRVLIRAYVDNKQGGWFPNLTWQHAWGQTVLGGEFRIHRSLHWGRIQKGSSDLPPAVSGPYQGLSYIGKRRYYEYKGAKDIFSPYVQNIFRLTRRIKLHLALQFVHQRYRLYDEKFIGTDFEVPYNFLNPRIGFNITLDPRVNFFVSYSRTTREPRLKTLYDAAEASTPASWGAVVPQFRQNPDGTLDFDNPLVKPEKLNDIEVGLGYRTDGFSGDVNFYYMDFRDEIVKKGQLDRFGQPITGNADRTLHTGVELSARARLLSGLTFTGNMTLSRNVLKRYTVYDSEGVGHVLDGNPIAGFPGFLANARLTYRRHGLIASVVMQHVGKQYTDNFANEAHTVDPYTVFHGTVGYNLGRWLPVKEFILQLHIQNIFDTLYITHGEGDEFFPAAERHFFVNAKLSL
ncbi:MAG: TonB-dependent receptor [Calditrichaeota bacterium]|nr:MAG: TonB-dependent receptor [Calditrichota bacterium]